MTSQATAFGTRTGYFGQSIKVILGLSLVLTSQGCTTAKPTAKSYWNQVPLVHWPSKANSSDKTDDQKKSFSEPAVAANVAVEVETNDDSNDWSESTNDEHSQRLLAKRVNRHPLSESNTSNGMSSSDLADANDPAAEIFSDVERSNSPMSRLNAALTDDLPESQPLPQPSLTTLNERYRVDRLLSQAKQMLEGGQVEQARQAARKAQELGETAQLDYSPDEERPIDLVRRIESQIEAIEENVESSSEKAISETPSNVPENGKPDLAGTPEKPSKPTGKDGTGLSRIRRDLTTLFRSNKKTTSPEANPITITTDQKTVQPVSTNHQPQPEQTGRSNTTGRSNDAVVLANRSVSLGPPETETTSDNVEKELVVSGLEREMRHSETPSVPLMDIRDQSDRDEIASASAIMVPRTTLETDETSIVPPDFDVTDATTPFQEVPSLRGEHPRNDDEPVPETRSESNWTLFYIAFGLCGAFALHCYRRGAT